MADAAAALRDSLWSGAVAAYEHAEKLLPTAKLGKMIEQDRKMKDFMKKERELKAALEKERNKTSSLDAKIKQKQQVENIFPAHEAFLKAG